MKIKKKSNGKTVQKKLEYAQQFSAIYKQQHDFGQSSSDRTHDVMNLSNKSCE